MKKGTKENPYSFDEYLELTKKKKWQGGYVDLGSGIIREIPPMEKDDDDANGCSLGSGDCGSGDEGDGSGSGSGSSDKPQYMVSPGVINDKGYIIKWTEGIASPTVGTGCSNKDGFVCSIYVQPELSSDCSLISLTSSYTWTAPYTALINAKYKYRKGNQEYLGEIPQFSFTIPSMYYEEF